MNWIKKIFASFSLKERLLFLLAAALSVLSGAGLLSLVFINTTKVAPARGGDYAEGMLGQPSYVNPLLADTVPDKDLVRLTFANIPDLAEKIERDKTGRVFRVRLKENLRWSDGEKLTSDDVIFTLQKLQDPQTASPYFLNWQGVAANRVSELELQFNLAAPYAFFKESLDNFYAVPKHLFADTPPANWKLSDYNLKPVGSGPYEFASYEKRGDGFVTAYQLKPNRNYAGDKPYIENFNLRFFTKPEDVLKSFNSGQIDAVADLEPETLKSVNRTYNLWEFSLPNYYAVFFNQSQNLALQDMSVREALSLATDRQSLVKNILSGHGKIANGPLPESSPALRAAEPGTNYDPASAAAILESAGWKTGGDGLREKTVKSAKLKLEFELLVPDIPFLTETAKALARDWKTVGVSAKLNILPAARVLSESIKNRSYQAVLFGNLLGADGDLYAFWHSSERYYPGLNLSLYSDKKTDKLLEAIRQNPDADARNAQFQNAVSAIFSAYPAVFLFSPSHLFVASKDLSGIQGGPLQDGADRLRQAKNWYVKVARVFK